MERGFAQQDGPRPAAGGAAPGIQYTATRVLAESPGLDDAVPRILQAICDGLGWTVGALWWVDQEADVLRCSDVWHSPSSAGG